jgi:hypothetical protein
VPPSATGMAMDRGPTVWIVALMIVVVMASP